MSQDIPARKSYLPGHEFQACRTLRGRSVEDVPALLALWKKKNAIIEHRPNGDYIVNGHLMNLPTSPKVVWDVMTCTRSGYFTFNGERIRYKQIHDYNPETGTFSTGDADWQLYPLPDA